jgi:hypothetical protein
MEVPSVQDSTARMDTFYIQKSGQKDRVAGMDTPHTERKPPPPRGGKKSHSEIYKMIPQCRGGGEPLLALIRRNFIAEIH